VFDIGFTELMMIALVGLVVIGPERLPKVARTVGHLLGRMQRYVSDVKSDINREMQLEDLKKLQAQVAEQAREVEKSVNEQMHAVETSLNQSILASAASNAEGMLETPATAAILPDVAPETAAATTAEPAAKPAPPANPSAA